MTDKKSHSAIRKGIFAFLIIFLIFTEVPFASGKYSKISSGTLTVSFKDIGFIATEGTLDTFGQILNDTEGGYQTLINSMNSQGDRADTTYIGNVAGATDADTEALKGLFGDNLTYDGEPITLIIKREDLNGDGVEEMTIYMTADTPGGNFLNPTDLNVYAAVFESSQDASGKTVWTQIGEAFAGTAPSYSYGGNPFGTYDSFRTNDWKSSETYNGVNSPASLSDIVNSYQ